MHTLPTDAFEPRPSRAPASSLGRLGVIVGVGFVLLLTACDGSAESPR